MQVHQVSSGRLVMIWLAGCLPLVEPIAGATEPAEKPREYRQQHMGVDVQITLYGGREAAANDAAVKAFARIAELNAVFSDYDPVSEAMRLCRTAPVGEWRDVSRDLWRVLEVGNELSRRSDGAFDVTLGPLTKLWRRARRRGELPDPAAIAEARARTGWQLVQLDPQTHRVALQRTGMQLDFGAIAKGYAAQEALDVLRQSGHPQVLVSIAGDIAAGEAPPGRPGWRIGIAPLDGESTTPSRYLCLKNAAVSTSGDAFQYVEIEGVRYSHILDPRTGLGLTHHSSVTVVAPNGMLADALDTTACVLGPERGSELVAATPTVAALFVVRDGDQVRTLESPGFARWDWHDTPQQNAEPLPAAH